MTEEAAIPRQEWATNPSGVSGGARVDRRGALGPNLAANAVNMLGTAFAVLWFTPYLTRNLGMAAFGLVALANSLLPYLALSTVVLSSAVSRHVTVHLEQGEERKAGEVFNTCLWGSLALSALLLPAMAVVIANADTLFVTPPGYLNDFRILLWPLLGAFLLVSLGIPFNVSTVARNRLDISNGISLVYTLVRVGAVVLIFQFALARVWHVGAGLVAAGIISLFATMWAWRRLTPHLKLSPRLVSRPALGELTSTGGWALLDAVGTLLYLNTELIVVNRMLGPETAGNYAAVLQWPTIIRSGVLAISPVFLPPMLFLFAGQDLMGLSKYCRQCIRLLGLVVALPIGLVCGLSGPLLGVWLGAEFAAMAPLIVLMTAHLAVDLCAHPLLCAQLAANRLKAPAIVTVALGLANLGVAVWLSGPVGWGVYGVAAAGAITLSVRMLVFAPLYAAGALGVSSLGFYRELLLIGCVTLAAGAAGWAASSMFTLNTWAEVVGAACAVTALIGLAALPLIRSKAGRESVRLLLQELRTAGGGQVG